MAKAEEATEEKLEKKVEAQAEPKPGERRHAKSEDEKI